jgi:hypothetical protein
MKNRYFFCLALFFCILQFGQSQEVMLLKTSGKVVIGDTTQISTPGNYNLYVQNGILTEKVKVSLKSTADWSDDAFNHTPSLAEVAQSIIDKSHLIDMPSADSVVKEGYEVTDMDAKLLQQIEWLWQHVIEIKAENEELKKQIQALKK